MVYFINEKKFSFLQDKEKKIKQTMQCNLLQVREVDGGNRKPIKIITPPLSSTFFSQKIDVKFTLHNNKVHMPTIIEILSNAQQCSAMLSNVQQC